MPERYGAEQAVDRTWAVIVRSTARPVEIDGVPQVGMTENEAVALAANLNTRPQDMPVTAE